jgi:DNA polymerase III sliding clamp (beta) subunit (PCNA family)
MTTETKDAILINQRQLKWGLETIIPLSNFKQTKEDHSGYSDKLFVDFSNRCMFTTNGNCLALVNFKQDVVEDFFSTASDGEYVFPIQEARELKKILSKRKKSKPVQIFPENNCAIFQSEKDKDKLVRVDMDFPQYREKLLKEPNPISFSFDKEKLLEILDSYKKEGYEQVYFRVTEKGELEVSPTYNFESSAKLDMEGEVKEMKWGFTLEFLHKGLKKQPSGSLEMKIHDQESFIEGWSSSVFCISGDFEYFIAPLVVKTEEENSE